MSKKRIAELDILRATAFIFVVLQHTVGGFSYRDNLSINNLLISKFIYTIAKAGVPIFLFLSAVTLIYTYNDKLNIKEFYIKKIKFLFLPFKSLLNTLPTSGIPILSSISSDNLIVSSK